MKAVKKPSNPNADRELDHKTFMSAEQLRGYMSALMIKWIVENLFVGNKLAGGDVHWSEGKDVDLRAADHFFASLGDNITPPQQVFNWIADLYPTIEALKANGQVIVGLMHGSVGDLGIFVSGAIAKKEHAQIVELLEYIEHLPPGLYGERPPGDAARYEVTLTERGVEDLRQLQKYNRRDEVPFNAVAELSELNTAFMRPSCIPLSPRPSHLPRIRKPFGRRSRGSTAEISARPRSAPDCSLLASSRTGACSLRCSAFGILVYSTRVAPTEHPDISYAMIFPLMIIVKVVEGRWSASWLVDPSTVMAVVRNARGT